MAPPKPRPSQTESDQTRPDQIHTMLAHIHVGTHTYIYINYHCQPKLKYDKLPGNRAAVEAAEEKIYNLHKIRFRIGTLFQYKLFPFRFLIAYNIFMLMPPDMAIITSDWTTLTGDLSQTVDRKCAKWPEDDSLVLDNLATVFG